jgi:hypothetical protein
MSLIRSLIRHPKFAGKVTDVVVEFGNGRYQSLMDRYMQGEDVSRSELRQVWENTTQISGVCLSGTLAAHRKRKPPNSSG